MLDINRGVTHVNLRIHFTGPISTVRRFGGQVSLARCPSLIWETPSSRHSMTWPWPRLNVKGNPRSREESNFRPLVRVPSKSIQYVILYKRYTLYILNTVQGRYNAVNLLPNYHNRHPKLAREGDVCGVCHVLEVRFMLYRCHRSDKLERVIMALDCICAKNCLR